MTTSPSRNIFVKPSFFDLFAPKLWTVLKEGYGYAQLRADLIAGLTVAIVALPLSMAIAIASGTTPDKGLITAIIGGFIISAFGGSRFQIGGPAGAFIVLVADTINRTGTDGLILAIIISGFLLIALGLFRLGTYIKFIPYPVTVGFTAGIAVIIFSSQIKDLLGLSLANKEPGPFIDKVQALSSALPSAQISVIAMACFSLGGLILLKILKPRWPGMLIIVCLSAIITTVLTLPIDTIGSRFGGIDNHFPLPSLPHFTIEKLLAILPDAIAFTLLGGIESLLSAVVADSMSGRRHRANCELVAQGIANIASALFGGICVTGTIARTATNVRAGASGPIAGIFHALFLLLFILIAAPLARYIPLAALAGILTMVAWNMVEKHAFWILLRSSWGDALVLMTTFLLTVFRDLTEGIVVGFALGSILFINRMATASGVEAATPLAGQDKSDGPLSSAARDEDIMLQSDIVIYRITGAFFFGAASSIGRILDQIADQHRNFIIDFGDVPFLDSTAANVMHDLALKAQRQGIALYITGGSKSVNRTLFAHEVRPPLVHYFRTIERALAHAKKNAVPPHDYIASR